MLAKMQSRRYVHRTDAFTALIFIAGTCLDRRTPDPKAGWAPVHARAPARPITQKSSLLAWKGRGLLATMAPRPATGRSFALPLPPCVLNSDPTEIVSAHLSSLSIPSMWLRALPHGPKLGSKSNGKRARGRTSRTGIYGRHCWVRLRKPRRGTWLFNFGRSRKSGTWMLMMLQRRLPSNRRLIVFRTRFRSLRLQGFRIQRRLEVDGT